MPQKWDYFRLGHNPAAALTILKLEVVGLLQHETKYQIRYDCCGGLAVLTHTQIKSRVRKSNFRRRSKWLGSMPIVRSNRSIHSSVLN